MEITVIGAGIAGLTAAITAAEQGQPVRLLEKRPELGGRARTLPPPYRANLGPHALYADGSHWQWLAERGLLPATVGRGSERLLYGRQGELTAPPPAFGPALQTIAGQRAPADMSFSCWAEPLIGPDPTQAARGSRLHRHLRRRRRTAVGRLRPGAADAARQGRCRALCGRRLAGADRAPRQPRRGAGRPD